MVAANVPALARVPGFAVPLMPPLPLPGPLIDDDDDARAER